MSTVRRSIFINPIEPSPLSFRAGAKTDTILDVTYYGQNGLPIAFDVDAQLQLVSRSTKVRSVYSVPARDIVNGRARATIPASTLSDINGYQAILYGSINGDATIIARGLVEIDDVEDVLAEPIDVIDQVPLTLDRSITIDTAFVVKLWDDTGKTDPYDLGTSSLSAAIYDSANRAIKLTDFVVAPLASNSVQMSLTPAQIAVLPDSCWWGLRISDTSGVTTLCEGPVTVTGTAP